MARKEIQNLLRESLRELQKEGALSVFDLPEMRVEKPESGINGDYSSSLAMSLTAQAKMNPRELAELIKDKVLEKESKMFEKIEVAGAGFINFFISKSYLVKEIKDILKEKSKFGDLNIGEKKRINIEFISANPTGPLTVGNSRGGVIGDVLSNVFSKAGWNVTREYYFNDAGGQIDILGHSILKDDLAEYKGDYIDELGKKLGKGDARKVGEKAAKILIGKIKKTTRRMGIKFDVWTAEGKDLREKGKVEEVIRWIKEKGLSYKEEGALWFKSTQFGDDKDRVLIKNNGEPTYFALDCAYHKNKFVDRKFDRVINVWGADHYGDMARVKGFIRELGYEDKFDILMNQFVRIIKDGVEVRMSKRTGTFVSIDELLDEVGLDVTRFFFLTKSSDTHLNFDLNLAKQQSEKNPVFYVQYAYARINSILRKAKAVRAEAKDLFEKEAELNLIKQLMRLPEIVEDTMKDYQTQRIPQYAMDLAASFHRFYHECRVISEDKEATKSRIALVSATKIILKNTLDLMGVSSPEKM
jgi:arginyl-tRNA synthetase